MTVAVWTQAYSLLGALLLGLAVGLWYDVLRNLRYRIPSRIFCGLLDLLFWLVVTAALFLWSVRAGDGVVQLSVCAALFLGGVLYFRFCSAVCFPVLSRLFRLAGKLLRLLLTPLRALGCGGKRIGKFFAFFCKKLFSFPRK